jgi:hypothetical protein
LTTLVAAARARVAISGRTDALFRPREHAEGSQIARQVSQHLAVDRHAALLERAILAALMP